jgi:hypothetical protein
MMLSDSLLRSRAGNGPAGAGRTGRASLPASGHGFMMAVGAGVTCVGVGRATTWRVSSSQRSATQVKQQPKFIYCIDWIYLLLFPKVSGVIRRRQDDPAGEKHGQS